MNRRNRRLLIDGLHELGLDLGSRIESIVRYCDEILLWNRRMNLVGGTERDIVIRHILDSLAVLGPVSSHTESMSGLRIADAGSGAGLPGVPIAIAAPDCVVTLIERSVRRVSFLTTITLLLELSNVTVAEDECEKHQRTYDLVLCRAFHPFEKAIPILAPLVAEGGSIGFYAAAPPPVIDLPTGYAREDLPLSVPFLEAPRTLVLLTRT